MDDLCDTRGTLGFGTGEWSHDWRIHSYTAGYRNRCGVDQNHTGAKTPVNDLEVLICLRYIYKYCNRMVAHLNTGGAK